MSAPKPLSFKLSFAGAKNKITPKTSGQQPPAKRARLLDDDEPEETETSVAISGWDTSTGGAIDLNATKKEEKVLPVIPAQPNRNWREAGRRQDAEKARVAEQKEEDEKRNVQFGLIYVKKEEAKEEGAEEEVKVEPQDDGLTEEQRLEKRALSALLNGKPTAEQTVIPAASEEEVFEHDFRNAPDAPDLDDYEAVPIDGFGAALLRGMGWKDGEEIGRRKDHKVKAREVKRRPALLGIGAKEEAAVGVELGAWGKGKGRGGKEAVGYVPVVKRNKITGEIISEEELKRKLEQQDMVKDEGEGRRRDKYELEEDEEERRERKSKDRRIKDSGDRDEKRNDRDRDRRRDDDRRDDDRRERRDRSRDRDGRRKERRRDEDYSSDKKRDSRRERDYSDDERRREKRREKEPSRRDRDRSRSPDSDDRRKRRRDYDDEREDRKRRHKDDGYRERERERESRR